MAILGFPFLKGKMFSSIYTQNSIIHFSKFQGELWLISGSDPGSHLRGSASPRLKVTGLPLFCCNIINYLHNFYGHLGRQTEEKQSTDNRFFKLRWIAVSTVATQVLWGEITEPRGWVPLGNYEPGNPESRRGNRTFHLVPGTAKASQGDGDCAGGD
jgi:hypothetical protein